MGQFIEEFGEVILSVLICICLAGLLLTAGLVFQGNIFDAILQILTGQ